MEHEIQWRLANTIQVYQLSRGSKPNDLQSGSRIADLERRFGKKLDKYRPWGMVVHSGESSVVAEVFSRTSRTETTKRGAIPHSSHGDLCKINVDGAVDPQKTMKVLSKVWLSQLRLLPGLRNDTPVACKHKTQECDRKDHPLADAITKVDSAALGQINVSGGR